MACQNFNRSDTNSHAFPQLTRQHDVVIIGEPRIINIKNTFFQVSHPTFQLATPTAKHTKISIYVSKKFRNYHTIINCQHTIVHIIICTTTIYGLYAAGTDTVEDLKDDLVNIRNNGRVCILGDFNAHHSA